MHSVLTSLCKTVQYDVKCRAFTSFFTEDICRSSAILIAPQNNFLPLYNTIAIIGSYSLLSIPMNGGI